MEVRTPLLVSALLIAGMLAVSVWAWPTFADNAVIAVHFDLAGHANGFMSRDWALAFMPATGAITTVFFAVLPCFTKRKEGLAASWSGYVAAWIGTMMILFVVHCLVVLKARGWHVDVLGSVSIIVALFFIVIGNVLGKMRPNPYVGVRTPWTRKSEYAWDKTNRVAGRMMVAVGLVTFMALAAAGSLVAYIVTIGGAVLMAAISIYLSYYYWRRDPARHSGND